MLKRNKQISFAIDVVHHLIFQPFEHSIRELFENMWDLVSLV